MKKLFIYLFLVGIMHAAEALFVTVGSLDVPARALDFSTAVNRANAGLVYGGTGNAPDPSWANKVVVLDRGGTPNAFIDKIKAVQSAGGVACVIANNASGPFTGSLGTGNSSAFPAVTISMEDGAKLRALADPVVIISAGVAAPVLPLAAHKDEYLSSDGAGWKFAKTQPAYPIVAAVTMATAGETVTFSVRAEGTPPFTYQWSKDGVNVDGATAAALVLPNVQAGNAGVYVCAVANGGGSTPSNSFTLTVNGPAAAAPAR